MATTSQTTTPVTTRSLTTARPILDWAMALGSLWMIAGLHLDGWAHHNFSMETFFTPWHAVLYSGFTVTAAAVGLAWLNGLRQGRAWQAALSPAYRTSLLGAVLFAVGGLADMTWHTLLGIETSIEALLSPPHLFLALGGGLLISGPLRSALYRSGPRLTGSLDGKTPSTPAARAVRLPALLSLIALVGLLAFFTSYASPWYELTDAAYNSGRFAGLAFGLNSTSQTHLVTSILLQTALLMGAILLLARSFRLPFGTLTLLLTLTTALAASIHTNWGLIVVGLLGGLLADGLLAALGLNRPGAGLARLRVFAFLVPVLLYLVFFSLLKLYGELNWSLEMWGGSVLLAGACGWLLSYGFFPASMPEYEA